MRSVGEYVRRHRLGILLYVGFSLFFVSAAVYSAATYSSVVEAQTKIVLGEPVHGLEVLSNGSLRFTFSVQLVNPSGFDLHVYSTAWNVFVENGTVATPNIFLANEIWGSYTGTTLEIVLPAGESYEFTYDRIVSDRSRLTKLWGFINYSAGQGLDYELEAVPYVYSFEVLAWIGEFRHDYDRARYLNDLVRVDLDYSSAWEEG